ncbi:MAG: tail fiber domain-containing protein [Chitinophagales bacterium]
MKNQILSFFLLLGILHTSSAQITNTFPLDDSVGIGTTSPVRILDVRGDMLINGLNLGLGQFGSNILFGQDALFSNISGSQNVALGFFTLSENTSGSNNIAVGQETLKQNISGQENTAVGNSSSRLNEGGSNNVAVGFGSLYTNKNSNNNTAIGSQSMYFSFKGDYNVAAGYLSLYNNTKGDYNTAIGAQALDFNTSGNNNTALGYNADVSANNFSNAAAIGNGALVDASNKVRIGNASTTSNGGQVEWTAYSDARIKTNVQENVPGLEFINLLKPITYHFDVDKQNQLTGASISEKQEGMYDIEKIQFTGFLAQDVDAAAKKINYDFSGVDKSGDIIGLRYSSFVVPMVKAIQELDVENANLKAENETMNGEIESLEKRISKLEKLITKQGITTLYEPTTENYKYVELTADGNVAMLGQNNPNPFNGKTSIQYYVPENIRSAQIKITTQNGVELKIIELERGNGVVELDAKQIASGSYFYSLIIDGEVSETKQMMLAK